MEQGEDTGTQAKPQTNPQTKMRARRSRLLDRIERHTDVNEASCSACPSSEVIKAVVAAEVGAPSNGIYQAINTMISNVVTDRQCLRIDGSPTVRLSGDGSNSPLKAQFADGAISAADSSISVITKPDGTIALAAAANDPAFSSPDGSIKITMPTIEGGPVQFTCAMQCVGSDNVIVTPTVVGGASTYTFSIPPSAINPAPASASTIPVDVLVASDGKFYLGVDSSHISSDCSIPRTVVIGGRLGGVLNIINTIDAITNAIAYINTLPTASAPTIESPWQILALPGFYADTNPISLPLNVNLVALIPGSVQIVASVTIKDTSSGMSATTVSGVTLNGTLVLESTDKTGGTYRITVSNCRLRNSATVSLRLGTEATDPQDRLLLEECIVTSGTLAVMTLTGSIITLVDTVINTQQFLIASHQNATSLDTRVQMSGGGVYSPTVLQNARTSFTLLSSTLDGDWTVTGINTYCSIISCVVRPTWTLTPNGNSRTYIRDTTFNETITRVDASGSYSWTSSNLLASTSPSGQKGTVDRTMSFKMLALFALTTASVSLVPSLTTPFMPTIPATIPIPWVQPKSSTLSVIGGATGIYPLSTSTTSLLQINNGCSVASSNLSVRVDVPIPDNSLWYPY